MIAVLFILRAFSAFGQEAEPPDPLAEMRAIEEQIRSKLIEQSQRDTKIKDIDESLRLAGEMLRGNERVRKENRKVLEGLEGSLERDVTAIQTAIDDSRGWLERSRGAVALAAPMTLQSARDRGASSRRTALTAILQAGHREQAQLAVEQALRLEELKSSRSEKKEIIGTKVDRYAELGELPLKKLRERHKELSKQVGRLNALSSGTQKSIAQLESRRQALNELVEGLASGRLTSEDVRKLDRRYEETHTEIAASATEIESPRSEPPPPGDIPEIPYDDEQTELPLGTREGDGAPLMTLEIPGDSGQPGESGPRKSFWRAEKTTIHALAKGTVIFGGGFAGYRHLLIIDHGGGWTSLYGNIEECPLLEGAVVESGVRLGSYQTLEESKSDPLWIEVRENAKPVAVERLPGAGADWEHRLFGE